MAILSEFTILKRMIDGESSLLEGRAKPSGLKLCEEELQRIKTENPTGSQLGKIKESLDSYLQETKSESFKDIPNWEEYRMGEIRRVALAGNANGIMVHDFAAKAIGGMTYDLRLGKEIFLSSAELPMALDSPNRDTNTASIEPGEFAIAMTHEYICLPRNLAGLISVRMRYKSQGLVNISGFHVDPGFYGRIIYSMYNAGPSAIVLRHKDPVFMILFEDVDGLVSHSSIF
jgi:deoxycytidine triphosphate deaminase